MIGAVSALALLAGLGFGLAPALSASQIDLTETMKTGSQRSDGWILDSYSQLHYCGRGGTYSCC